MPGGRRRRVVLAALACALTAGAACGAPVDAGSTAGTTPPPVSPAPGSSSGASTASTTSATPGIPSAGGTPTSSPTATPTPTLPRGGTTVFPRFRLVGYSGRTGASALGRLGIGGLDARMSEMIQRAKPYAADGRQILPVAEVIATVVQASPGKDGKYRTRMSDHDIAVYLAAARRHKAVLLLNIQPGRSDFLTEVEAYDRWLREPDVGVALDPEWAMGAHQVPGRGFGHTTGGALDAVSAHLADVVKTYHLPEKILVFHELAPFIVTKEGALEQHPGVAVVKSVDGIGTAANKRYTYREVNRDTPRFVHPGFKLFYEEDRAKGKLMTPAAVLGLSPRPAYVLYE